ncbi:hypothetical protein BC567DRAFT_212981 [Phyllosticta citribraziliensis]
MDGGDDAHQKRWNLRPRKAPEQKPSRAERALPATWAGKTGHQILQGERLAWTESDLRIFRIHAARNKWWYQDDEEYQGTAKGNRPPAAPRTAQLQELQQDLGLCTAHDRLNRELMRRIEAAVFYDLTDRLNRSVLRWPLFTQIWFLDPTWTGSTTRPPTTTITPWVAALSRAWTRWTPLEQHAVFLFLRALDHHGLVHAVLPFVCQAMDDYIDYRVSGTCPGTTKMKATTVIPTRPHPPPPPPPPLLAPKTSFCALSPIMTVCDFAPVVARGNDNDDLDQVRRFRKAQRQYEAWEKHNERRKEEKRNDHGLWA